jgi:hypothetical protein
MAEDEQEAKKKKKLLVSDELFDDRFQDMSRDQRSTLFYGASKTSKLVTGKNPFF